MQTVKVPLGRLRLSLFALYGILLLVFAFLVTFIVYEGETYVSDDKLVDQVEKAPLSKILIQKEQQSTERLRRVSRKILRDTGSKALAVFAPNVDDPEWVFPNDGFASLPGDIARNLEVSLLHKRIIRHESLPDKGLFIYPLTTEAGKQFYLLLQMDNISNRESMQVEQRLQGIWSRLSEHALPAGLVFGGMLVLHGLLVLLIPAVHVAAPVQRFTAMLDRWDSESFSYRGFRGMMRYVMAHVLGLLERYSPGNGKEDAVVEHFVKDKTGFDIEGFNAAGIILRRLGAKKDVYDVLPLPNGQLAIFRVEVSGHDEASSLLLARVYWLARAFCRSFSQPALVVSEINRVFTEEASALSISLFAGFYTPASRELVFSQAGGMPLYRYQPGAQRVRKYHLDIPPAGLIDSELYKEKLTYARLQLDPGDICVLLTDSLLKISDAGDADAGTANTANTANIESGNNWEIKLEEMLLGSDTMAEKILRGRTYFRDLWSMQGIEDDLAVLFWEA